MEGYYRSGICKGCGARDRSAQYDMRHALPIMIAMVSQCNQSALVDSGEWVRVYKVLRKGQWSFGSRLTGAMHEYGHIDGYLGQCI